ncbi:RNA polymerase sigma-70 factor [Geomicrobium sp. JCM 19038]|nr:RNA polymerase sigma-70 factor [Geomicrobium sp. JCM 19038]
MRSLSRERKLIKRIRKKGHHDAANELVSMYYTDLLGYVKSKVSDEELARDLTQEIFIHMLESIRSFDERKASFRTWLYTIASHRMIDYFRSKAYQQAKKTRAIDVDDRQSEDFTEQLFRSFEVERILEFLQTFKESERQIVRGKLLQGERFVDLADKLNMPESTIKTKYYTSLKRIKDAWEVDDHDQ